VLIAITTPALAAGPYVPQVDVLANRALLHTHGDGLYIAFTGEGFRKYVQEYSQPWGATVEFDGVRGRALPPRSATLTFPWQDAQPATVRLRVHGLLPGQKVSVFVNAKNITNANLEPTWQTALYEVPAGALRARENDLRLTFARSATAGTTKAHAVVASIEIVAGKLADAGPTWPAEPVGRLAAAGTTKPALTGFPRFSFNVEIPAAATLEFETGVATGQATFEVAAVTTAGTSQLVGSFSQGAGWQGRSVNLATLAGQLVRLDFRTTGAPPTAVGWAAPRITTNVIAGKPPRRFKNAVLIVVDALRADRLSLYGKTRVQTPHTTREAEASGVVFLHNQAASPSSPPSHGSIQTGMIPRVHGVSGDKGKIAPGTPTISTQLGEAGFATGYFGNNPFGMGRLKEPGRWTAFHQPGQEGKGMDCSVLVKEMLNFAVTQSRASKRFFISSLPYEPHTPYLFHEGITPRYHKGSWGPPVGKHVDGDLLAKIVNGKVKLSEDEWSQLRGLYDGEVERWDQCFAELLAGLRKDGLWKDTLVVVTADHGEGMFEHGYMGHAFGHFREVADVPLIVLGEGLTDKGFKVDVVSSHIDIVPTILDLLGVAKSPAIQGQSLEPLITTRGAWTPRVVSLEYGRSFALRARRWKYIVDYQGQESVFDLQTDPGEQKDLAQVPAGALPLRYMRDLTGLFLAHRNDWKTPTWGDINNHRRALAP
jgi:arylsulfatase A-like enzyme